MRQAEMVGIVLMKVMEIDDTAREDGELLIQSLNKEER